MSYPVDDKIKEEFTNLKIRRKYKWMISTITKEEPKTHVLESVESDKTKDVRDLVKLLPEADCKYVVLEHIYKSKDGRDTDKLYFISWNPRGAHQQTMMEFTTARKTVRPVCDGCFDIHASTTDDILDEVLGRDEESEDEENDDWMN